MPEQDGQALELAADELLLELAEVDEDDDVRPELIRERCLERLRQAPPDATYAGVDRDDAIFILEWSKKRGKHEHGRPAPRRRAETKRGPRT